MLRAVLDTNVIISGILHREGSPGQLLEAALAQQRFQLITSIPIFREVGDVLRRPRISRRHGWSESEISLFLARLYSVSLVVESSPIPQVITQDPSDDMFLAAAVAGDADYLVSGDVHLLQLERYGDIPVRSPRQFLDLLSTGSQE